MRARARIIIVLCGILFLTSVGTAQQATAEITEIRPSTTTVTAGDQLTVDLSYSTSSVDSCTLDVVESSLPGEWSYDGAVSVDPTGGDTDTVDTPTISTRSAEPDGADITFELSCSTATGPVDATSSMTIIAREPPSLSGTLESDGTIDVSAGETYDITFSVSNTGSSATQNAIAEIETPTGYDAPATISLKEAGQDDGVIRAGRSTGDQTFTITAGDQPTDGEVLISLTSADTGVTDSMTVQLDAPAQDNDDDPPDDPGGSGGGGSVPPPSDPETDRPGLEETIDTITPENGAQIQGGDGLGVEAVTVNVSEQVNDVTVSMNNHQNRPETISAPAAETYQYLSINASGLNDTAIERAAIRFSVNASWIQDNTINRSTITLERFHDGSWETLDTTYHGKNSTRYRFTAATPGFSYFAVQGQQNQTEPEGPVCGDGVCEGNETASSCPTDCETDDPTGPDGQNETDETNQTDDQRDQPPDDGTSMLVPLLIAGLGGVVLIGIILIILFRREQVRALLGRDRRTQSVAEQRVSVKLDKLKDEIQHAVQTGTLSVDREELMDAMAMIDQRIEQENYQEAEQIIEQVRAHL